MEGIKLMTLAINLGTPALKRGDMNEKRYLNFLLLCKIFPTNCVSDLTFLLQVKIILKYKGVDFYDFFQKHRN